MTAAPARLFDFIGGSEGTWRVDRIGAVTGDSLPAAARLQVVEAGGATEPTGSAWQLRGITSNERYVERSEKQQLLARQPALGRPEATRAALIPIRKNAAWWAMTQDERRTAFEVQSRHIAIGLDYLPAVARRLHHCRDLDAPQPFDFLTWFEYAPADAEAFEALVAALRASPEWAFVDREVDLRLSRGA
ncbi:chlorite dismutase family protein [Rhizobacter sp. OV335]|uniref:chlorite dismutase family protein n=1 Tax=Rhizobacter sp. OV335 TaxID=1500264 RepID=UPI000922FC4C|nr:chlorite dismutase family protein [Rhizobacter sp. OV335]SHM98223.1 Chlorite dismutase [Rhizobacter sp. OV335]